ncbi:unnamed protein product [Rhodiola kirilowii]
MTITNLLALSIALTSLVSVVTSSDDDDDDDYDYNRITWITNRTASSSSRQAIIDECRAHEDSFKFESESNRRILGTSQCISYGAMNRDRVPGNQHGASYCNSTHGAEANTYRRGCSAINRSKRTCR